MKKTQLDFNAAADTLDLDRKPRSNQQPLPLVEQALSRKGFSMRDLRDFSTLNYRTLRKRMNDPSQFVMADFSWLSEALQLSPQEVFELVQRGIKEKDLAA